MDNWEKIKQEIKLETKDYFKGKDVDTDELVEVLRKVLAARIDEGYELDGVAVRIPKAMYGILDGDTTKKERELHFAILCKYEPFLKKMLYFLNRPKFQWIFDQKKGLGTIIGVLGLDPNNIDCRDEDAQRKRADTDYDYHLFRVYNLRNNESHNMELWNQKEMANYIESILIFYMEALNRHKHKLKEILSNQVNDFSDYIASVIHDFEFNSRRFISTESIEDFSAIFGSNHVSEHRNSVSENETDQERTGTVDFIRKNCLRGNENGMLLWGDAGMGKSTTLQYLAYIDAKDYESGKSRIIPVYVPLGMLINQEETLEQYICRQINVEYLTGVDLFKNGKINLFLDGVNEIPAGNGNGTQTRLKEIQNLLDTYPKMFIMLSNRPESGSCFEGIPVFRLQKMDLKKIREFLQKNADNEKVRETIIAGVENNHRLLQLIGTPLMATRLIEIVRELKEFPKSEGTIIKKFLESLYKRERYEKKDVRFDELIINHLLINLAVYGFQKNQTNSGLSNFEVVECFANCINRYHFSYDSSYALDILLKLGVLSSDKNKEVIVFSHQAYQDYYLSCAGGGNNNVAEKVKEEPASKDVTSIADIPDSSSKTLAEEINGADDEKEELPELVNSQTDEAAPVNAEPVDETEAFYQKYAKDERYEKSIIYRLHNADRELRNHNIKKLAKYNLLLAAKAISSGEPDPELEEYVIGVALENIMKVSNADIQLESILVFLELDRTEELKENISILIKNGVNIIKSIAMKLSGEQCVVFLDALSQQKEDNKLRNVLSIVFTVFNLQDYEYSWSANNILVIKGISERLNRMLKSSPYNLLIFYSTFNVPKEFFVYNLLNLLETVMAKHCKFVIEFVKKFNIAFQVTPKEIIQLAKKEKSLQNILEGLCVFELSFNEKYKILKRLFSNFELIRAGIYLSFPIKDQFEITKRYDVYYEHKKPTSEFRQVISKLWTSSEVNHIVFEMGLVNDYVKDGKKRNDQMSFFKYMSKSLPDSVKDSNENICTNSTLDDFINYKAFIKKILRKQRKVELEQRERKKNKRKK